MLGLIGSGEQAKALDPAVRMSAPMIKSCDQQQSGDEECESTASMRSPNIDIDQEL